MKMLLDVRQFTSAELLGNFIVSLPLLSTNNITLAFSNQNNQLVQWIYQALIMFADSIYGQSQYLRALKYYKNALDIVIKAINQSASQASSLHQQQPAAVGNNLFGTNSHFPKSLMDIKQLKSIEYDLRYKIALCFINTKKINLAISYLESIPNTSRSLDINLTMARLYKDMSGVGKERTKDAILCFKEVLRICPLCIEATIAIKELGEDPELFLTQVLHKQPISNANIDSSWIPALALSQFELKRNQPQKKLALSYLYHDEPSIINTINTFHKIRQYDSYYTNSMDIYCSLLKRRQLQFELNKVCHDLLNTNSGAPESWTSVALYYFLKENNEKAMECVDRAISLRETHPFSHSLKGEIYLSLEDPKSALPWLDRAFQLSKNILTARELVRCHLFLNQINEALMVAQAIHRMSPEYSKSMSLVGMVLANQPEERPRARKILSEALVLSPHCIDTVLTLSKLNMVEGKLQEALDLIQKQLEYQETDLMHTEMANIYVTKENYEDAMRHYNSALEINHQYEPAIRGLHRLELIMKGIDPDQEEEELEDDEEIDEDELDEDDMEEEDIIEDMDGDFEE
ncbi:anaphase promoting complex subunit 7 [Cavenderia fasciculata]|uniref:Anaphase promoting complex subunit 7 n=1 Tax=Cavenderia fasciculata TaxID=261658 RepID=F4PLE3_CACFS|nr:anaphase promoting complex subunit 7 [Cavenderia fasciculata]EGG23365.1 anaphase promoting complex subunit 7 [Cavenderia fasciculata]|eukprot:XP_004361216.1 anaphase promoting complex subunit 7 [Cavenderia fasciculata]